MGFLSSIPHSWEMWVLIHYSPFFHGRDCGLPLSLSYTILWGRVMLWEFLYPLPCLQKQFFFFLFQLSAEIFPLEILTFTKGLSSLGVFQSQCFPGAPRLMPRGARNSSQVPVRSTAWPKVCLPITQWTGGWDFFWVPWHMILDPTTPTEALLFMDRCQILAGKEEGWK